LIVTIRIPSGTDRVAVAGRSERNLKVLRESLGHSIHDRTGVIHHAGDDESSAPHAQDLCEALDSGGRMTVPSKDQHDFHPDKADILSIGNEDPDH